MEENLNLRNATTWTLLQQTGVLPHVKSLADYSRIYEENLPGVQRFLADQPAFVTAPEDVRAVHRLLFKNLTPWAGEFSHRQMSVGGRVGVPPGRAHREFELLTQQTNILCDKVDVCDPIVGMRAVAFTHARFAAIHAFPDGNGRVGRLLASHAQTLLTGRSSLQPLDPSDYMNGIRIAVDTHNLAPLAAALSCSHIGERDPAPYSPSPFRIPAFQEREALHISEELTRSRRERPELLACSSVPLQQCWLRDVRWETLQTLVNGHPSAAHDHLRELFVSSQEQEMTLEAAISLLANIKSQKPFTSPSIFNRLKPGGWTLFAERVCEPLLEGLDERQKGELTVYVGDLLEGKQKEGRIHEFLADLSRHAPPSPISLVEAPRDPQVESSGRSRTA